MRTGLTDARMSVLRQFVAGRAGSAAPPNIRFENEDPSVRLPKEILDSKSGLSATIRYRCVLDEWSTEFAPDAPPVLYDPTQADEAPTGVLHQEVTNALRRGIKAARQAAVVGDRRQLQRMAEALQALEYLRFEQRC